MKTIIVPIDFSTAALNAALYAAELARMVDAELIILHSLQVPVLYSEVPVAANADAMEVKANGELDAIKKHLLQTKGKALIIKTELKMGSFYSALLQCCNLTKPYMVIIGSQGTTATERFLFGGHAVHAMKHLPWPLMTVPMGATFHPIRNIALACDFHQVVESTPVNTIRNMITSLDAHLKIIHTGKNQSFDPEIVFESGMMQELLNGLEPDYHFIEADDVNEGLIDFVRHQEVDVLLVLPKHHYLIDFLIHKSNTKQLVLHCPVPVIALHVEETSS
jgi:nucleotide-binding universal stress UspA family protein